MGAVIKVDNSVRKINGLVNEYIAVMNACRMRWPMGLGKYLLLKLQGSMQGKGVLQVDKVSDHAGNFVYLNGRAVGLSNKLNDFESLAVRRGPTRPPSPSSPLSSQARLPSTRRASRLLPRSGQATKHFKYL